MDISTPTIRERIIDEVVARLSAIPTVGAVIYISDDDADADEIYTALDAGQTVMIVEFSDDEVVSHTNQHLQSKFDVAVSSMIARNGLNEQSLNPSSWANRIDALVYDTYNAPGIPESVNGWGGLAIETVRSSGGGLSVLEGGQYATSSIFTITYRHATHDASKSGGLS